MRKKTFRGPPFHLENPYCIVGQVLSASLCEKIIEPGEATAPIATEVIREAKNKVHHSTVFPLSMNAKNSIIIQSVNTIMGDANERIWRWARSGPGSKQYTRYRPDQ